MGGFSKYSGNAPDLVHSYLGLCAVSILGDQNIKEIYGPLGISVQISRNLKFPQLNQYRVNS